MTTAPHAITGAGVLCPIAADFAALGRALDNPGSVRTRVDIDFSTRLTPHQARRLDRVSQMLLVVARQASAGAVLSGVASDRIGVVVGTALGCLALTEGYLEGVASQGAAFSDALGFADSMDNAPATHCAIALGCHGPSFTVSEGSVSGESAIALAAQLLESREADAVLVAAADCPGAATRVALSRMTPGLSVGEGAGSLVLETSDSATRRGAPVLGRLLGRVSATASGVRMRGSERARLGAEHAAALLPCDSTSAPHRSAASESASVLRRRIGWVPSDGVLRVLGALHDAASGRRGSYVVAGGRRDGYGVALLIGGPADRLA